MPYKIIESKFPGRCDACGYDYAVGDYIAWAKGQPAYHEDCAPSAGTEPAAPPPKGGTPAATATERESGELRTLKAAVATVGRDQTTDRMTLASAVRGMACLRRALGALAALDPSVADHLAEYDAAMSTERKPDAGQAEGDDGIPF